MTSQQVTRLAPMQTDSLGGEVTNDATKPFLKPSEAPPPNTEQIGRYVKIRVLGNGGFGYVYLCSDPLLKREVAIKQPHRHMVQTKADAESYLKEAQVLSKLDHPSIVPVWDTGYTDDGCCFIVSKYIDGSDLKTRLKKSPLTIAASVELVATIADALHYSHIHSIVHRDVKPGNILLDSADRPYLADFGLAMREEDFGKGHERAGTIPYMSPEQLRGEGHLVNGRSDIFSLGVVLYELTTGKKAFPPNRQEFSQSLIEPRPPRQIDDSIPRELERIILRAMSYRVADRYITASDMATDLRLFLQAGEATNTQPQRPPGLSGPSNSPNSNPQSSQSGVQIIPKGLRSFDKDDAGFFLELLPGPRGRDGLPESVRFWKNRILAPESETFRVGVIYGPSGCGKSSFVKAAVLPQVSNDVLTIYIESTPSETEARLLKALRKAYPDLPADKNLTDSMTAIRRRQCGNDKRRLLIVLDQFEQWLHGRVQGPSEELIKALRQCDGANIQCLITVRDDFWMAVTHFMNDLEVTLVPENNLAVVDLFSVRHARRVLTAIGQAYGILPQKADEISEDQKAFINQAIKELSVDDRVIPVQLSLFAEMVKDKEWSPETLKTLGGTEGVGVKFLEETFNGRTASPHHRLHQRAARAVLQMLLPEGDTGIKGSMRSYEELLRASGYSEKLQDFESLMRILDGELRLITPTDPEGLDPDRRDATSSAQNHDRYFHLTHDYLVPSLQQWLTQKRKETRRGRAELVLADRAASWNKHHSNRNLPSFFEWTAIQLFAGRRAKQEHHLALRAATQYYGGRTFVAAGLLLLASMGVLTSVHTVRGMSLVESLQSANYAGLPTLITAMEPYRNVVDPQLEKLFNSSDSPRTRLLAAMALLNVDRTKQGVVYEGLLTATPDDFATICDHLKTWGSGEEITKLLWGELQNAAATHDRRLRAGAALAKFDPPDDSAPSASWRKSAPFLSGKLVSEIGANFGDFQHWVAALSPAANVLYPELHRIYSGTQTSEIDSYAAATVLAEFSQNNPQKLVDLVFRAKPREYEVLIHRLKELGHPAEEVLLQEYHLSEDGNLDINARNEISRRRAYAAATLLEFDNTNPLLTILSKHDNPTLCSYAEDRLSRWAVQPGTVYRLMLAANIPLRAALLRSLAGMPLDRIPEPIQPSVIAEAMRLWSSDTDAGVHSAAEWTLTKWGKKTELQPLMKSLASRDPVPPRNWYINNEGQTFVVFRAPKPFLIGSPPDEIGRDSDEIQEMQVIDRNFAVCTTEVSTGQFLKFFPKFPHALKKGAAIPPDHPIPSITWYLAAEYCNELSRSEGIPEDEWCYIPQKISIPTPQHPEGEEMLTMQYAQNCLTRTGYRLLTEAEWEFSCRADSSATFSWGNDPLMSPRYAQTVAGSQGISSPVASFCPNRFGFFDMHGNVGEWTNDVYNEKTRIQRDLHSPITITDVTRITLKGGSFLESPGVNQRTANRTPANTRTGNSTRLGMRIGRTLPK